jgi:hypothetical protein
MSGREQLAATLFGQKSTEAAQRLGACSQPRSARQEHPQPYERIQLLLAGKS